MAGARLALDLGTSAGWALRLPAGALMHGAWSLPTGPHPGQRFASLRARVMEVTAGHQVTSIGYEDVNFIPAGHQHQWRIWGGMHGVILMMAAAAHVPVIPISPNQMRKYVATGKTGVDKRGRPLATKVDVQRGVELAIGRQLANEDEADAIAVLLSIERMIIEQHKQVARYHAA